MFIVTAASQELAEVLAHVLVLDGGIGMRSEVRDGVYTGRSAGPFTYREGKAEAIRQLAAERGIDLSESFAYSDSESDLPMMRAVGHPVAVNPDSALERTAREEGWRIMRFDKLARHLKVAGAVGTLALVGGSGGYLGHARRPALRPQAYSPPSLAAGFAPRLRGMAVEPREMTDAERWFRERYAATPERDGLFTTLSGEEVEPLYTAEDVGDAERIGLPGEYPFTRGVYPSMYRGRLWTMRQFAGFGTAEETNERFRYLLDHGQTGLSTAFDMPSLMGHDSDHPRSLGEVGREGVAIDSLTTWRSSSRASRWARCPRP